MSERDHQAGMTVGEVATHLGVTVRTLHHWDEIALASPSHRTVAGYRLYDARDIVRLQRVVIYRELGVGLEQIRSLLDGEHGSPLAALREQLHRTAEQAARFTELAKGLERMIRAHERGILLSADQQLAIFGQSWRPEWIEEAQQRWGRSPQWAEYAEKASERSPEQWAAIAKSTDAVEGRLAAAFQNGVAPESEEARKLAEEHREAFSAYFSLTREMQVCLARMYEHDQRFSDHYERRASGLTAWLRRAVESNARAHGIDPERASWPSAGRSA